MDGLQGTLRWLWLVGMDHEEILRVLVQWNEDGFDAVVWDNASSHLEDTVKAWGMPLVQQSTYSPDLNPAERANEEIRRFLKGKTFRILSGKILTVENRLSYWEAHPEVIQRLCGYPWIRNCFELLDQVSPEKERQDSRSEVMLAA